MVTIAPNEFVSWFHDRMPVVLDNSEAEVWLGNEPLPVDRLAALCRELPSVSATRFASRRLSQPSCARAEERPLCADGAPNDR